MIHIGDMEDAGHRPFQTCKDPLDTGTEARREPCKAAHAGDQVSPCKGDRSKLRETEDAGEVAASSVSTRPPGGGDGRDLETYWQARKDHCRANRRRMGGAHLAARLDQEAEECRNHQHAPNDPCEAERDKNVLHLPALLSEEIARPADSLIVRSAIGRDGCTFDPEPVRNRGLRLFKALALFVVEGLCRAHADTRVLGAGAR